MKILLLLLFVVTEGHAITDGMTISKMSYDQTSDRWIVHLGLESAERSYRAFQCDLAFPKGVTLSKPIRFNSERVPLEEDPSTGDMVRTHKLNWNMLKNGTLRMVVTSTTNRDFLGISGDILTICFVDDGVLDKSKSYNVNLTNIELVYKLPNALKNEGIRQQGLINDVSLRCHDAMCNNTAIYGEINAEDLDWMNNFLAHNKTLTSVDVTHCTNAKLGTLHINNPNTLIYTNRAEQIGGNLNIVVNGNCKQMDLTDKMPFQPIKAFKANGATYSTTITEAGYATVVVPFSCTIPKGLEVYQLSSVDKANNVIKGIYLHEIEANKPILIKGVPGEYTFNGTLQAIGIVPENMQNGLLVGTYFPKIVSPGNYLMQQHGEEVAFYRVAESTMPGIKPFRAYLENNDSQAQCLTISLDSPTGIDYLHIERNGVNGIYNVNGQKLIREERGVNIIRNKNGAVRKYFIK